jgi:hypothetical protein
MRTLFRLFMIHIGIIAGCLAAAFAMVLIEGWTDDPLGNLSPEKLHLALMMYTIMIALMALVGTYVSSVVAGLVAEVLKLRSFLFYAIAGGVIGLLFAVGITPGIEMHSTGGPIAASPFKAYPAIGIIGGCAYWLVTGCKAGFATLTDPQQSIAPVVTDKRFHISPSE